MSDHGLAAAAYLGSSIEQLSRLFFDGRVQRFPALDEWLIRQDLAILVEAVKGIQADLHFDVCHLDIFPCSGGQHLQQSQHQL